MRIALAILIAASVSSCGRSELAPIFGDARACTVFQLPPVSRADASCASLSFTTPQTFSGPAVGNEMFTIRDINGDGYPDIIGTSDHTEIFFNKGDGRRSRSENRERLQHGANRPGAHASGRDAPL